MLRRSKRGAALRYLLNSKQIRKKSSRWDLNLRGHVSSAIFQHREFKTGSISFLLFSVSIQKYTSVVPGFVPRNTL